MPAAVAGEIRGTVVSIVDGDTLDVLTQARELHRVRVQGIDAPERSQPFARAAKRHLSDLVYAKEVRVIWHKKDRYGRLVGKVLSGTVDVGLERAYPGFCV